MIKQTSFFTLFISILLLACSQPKEEIHSALITGSITIADSLNDSGDFSGIKLTIFQRDSSGLGFDTLFNVSTNTDGSFASTVQFDDDGRYPVLISRNGFRLGSADILLADKDTVRITGELPNIEETFKVDSKEQRAVVVFERVKRNFDRVALFINTGQVEQDSIPKELKKFADLFFDIYQDNKGTFGATLAINESLTILNTLDDSLTMALIDENMPDEDMLGMALTYGKAYKAKKGVQNAVDYLAGLKTEFKAKNYQILIDQNLIQILFDSSRVAEADEKLRGFEKSYTKNEDAISWAEYTRFEIENLAPGMPMPKQVFSSTLGEAIDTEVGSGNPRLYEFVILANPQYQNEFETIKTIQSIFSQYNLEVVSIPFDESQVTIDAFYDERGKIGEVAQRSTIYPERLMEAYNLTALPTWILVDGEGKIVRKYIGNEINELISGITKAINIETENGEL